MTKLCDYILDIASGPFGSNLKVEEFVEYGFPVIDGANLKGTKVTDNITKFVTEQKARTLPRCIAKRGDVIVTISGTLGQIAYIPEDSLFKEYLVSQRQFRVTFDTTKVDVKYLVYYFHTKQGQKQILSFANYVGVPALSQPLPNFKNIEVHFPMLEEQRKIANILSLIDEQIQRNNAMVHKLQVLGQAIFANIMYNTTTTVTLGEIAEMYQPETITSDKFTANGQYPVYGAGGIIGQYDTYNHEDPALMISCRGVCGQVDISLPRSFIIGNQMIVKPYDATMLHFLYYYLKLCDLSSIETGSVQKQITRANLSKLAICLPDKSSIEECYPIFAHLYQQQRRIYEMTQKIIQVKNKILPMLMNGQIKI